MGVVKADAYGHGAVSCARRARGRGRRVARRRDGRGGAGASRSRHRRAGARVRGAAPAPARGVRAARAPGDRLVPHRRRIRYCIGAFARRPRQGRHRHAPPRAGAGRDGGDGPGRSRPHLMSRSRACGRTSRRPTNRTPRSSASSSDGSGAPSTTSASTSRRSFTSRTARRSCAGWRPVDGGLASPARPGGPACSTGWRPAPASRATCGGTASAR